MGKKVDQDSSRRERIVGTEHEKRYTKYLKQTYDFGNGSEETYIDFLKDRRIELNTIMTEIGPKRFWNWLYSKIVQTFPTRDYNRAISVPPYRITLPIIDQLNRIAERTIENCIEVEAQTITDELYHVKGLLNTDAKEEEIHDRLSDIVNDDEDVEKLKNKVEELITSLYGDEDSS